MKRYTLLLIALAGLFCFYACEKHDAAENDATDAPKVPTIAFSQQLVDAEVELNNYSVTVTAECAWEAESGCDWIVLEKSSGAVGTEELTFSVALNESDKERTGIITVKNAEFSLSAEVKVVQRVADPKLEIKSTAPLEFDYKGASKTVSVAANFEYDIEVTSSWITCSKVTDGVKIVAAANSDYEARTAEVKIYSAKYGKEGAVIAVNQGPCGCQLGDVMTINKTKGIVFYIGNNQIKLVSVNTTNSQYSTEYVETSANDMYNGANNMAKIKARSSWTSRYPAFKWCSDRGTGWYLPAYYELQELYNQKALVDGVLVTQNATPIGEWHWTSTEFNYSYAYLLNFTDGVWRFYNKDNKNEVRAIYTY